MWDENRAWGGVADIIPEPPSTYYHDHVFGCFFRDNHGVASIHEIGINNVTYETDYPHTDTSWPDTVPFIENLKTKGRDKRTVITPAEFERLLATVSREAVTALAVELAAQPFSVSAVGAVSPDTFAPLF